LKYRYRETPTKYSKVRFHPKMKNNNLILVEPNYFPHCV
jgi:hypothetical protein